MRLLALFLAMAFLSSCVSSRKYDELASERSGLQLKYNEAQRELESAQREIQRLSTRVETLQQTNNEVAAELQSWKDRYNQLDQANASLQQRYDRIIQLNEQLLETSSSEKKELTEQLVQKEDQLYQKEQELRIKEQNINALQANLTQREQRVRELEAAIAEKEAVLEAVRNKVNQALLGFSDADLSVTEKDGKIYVSLSQNLLFRSGSKTINREGRNAISRLGEVLQQNPDIQITVEGHTDTDGDADFNWDLSVQRATSVIKELTDSGVDPKRIIASGRGEYFPVAPNTTAAGKAQNRRTEIILTPNLDALYEIINN